MYRSGIPDNNNRAIVRLVVAAFLRFSFVVLPLISTSGRAAGPSDFWSCLANAPIEPIPAALDTCRAQLPKLGDGRHPNWALNALGNSQLRAHQPLKAANLYRTALSAVPASGREFAILSTNLALALGDTDPSKAIDWLKKACAADPSFAEARVNLALALLRQHTDSAPQSSAAEAHLNKALGILSAEQGPEAAHVKARIHLYLGNLLSDRAYTKDAGESNGVKSVQHPIASLDVEGMDARLAECQTYDCILDLSKMGSPSKPPTLQTGARSPSNPVGTVENGALVLPRQDRFVRPEDWNVQHERLSRTRFAAKAETFDTTVDHYQQAIALDPWLTDARINYGNLLKETGQLEAAAERYRSAYCHDNADFVALSNLGQTLFQLDQCEEAHRTLAQVKRLRSLFIPGESDDFGSHFLTTEPLCISRIVDNPQIHLTSMSHLASEACGETISVLTFWRSSVPMGPFELPTARAMNQVRSSGSISAIFPASEESKIDPAVVRVVATRYTMDPEPKMLAHFGSGVVVSRAADNALIATAYHTLTFPGCVPTPAVNANDAVQSEADLIRVQFLSDAPLEREARIVWRAIGNGKAEDVALLRVIGIPDTIPAAEVRRSVDLEADAPLAMVSWSKTGVRRSIKTVYRGTIDRGKRLVMSNLGFQSGDSGAPVFGSDGKVVGLVAGASSDESGIGRTGAQAIPIQAIADALARLNTTTCQAEDS